PRLEEKGMNYVAKSFGAAWGRGVAALSLAGVMLTALPQAPAAAGRFMGSSGRSFGSTARISRFGGGFGSGFGLSRFGVGLGGRNFRMHSGFSRFGHRRFGGFSSIYAYPYVFWPPYGGLYAYGSPYLSIFNPFYGYGYGYG